MRFTNDEKNMRLALAEAEAAGRMGEVPIGSVITDSTGNILSRGHNLRESSNDPTAHAEIIAIKKAAESLGSWRLEGTVIYVTLEPCLMCMGAIILARAGRLVFGARDPKAGAVVSVLNSGSYERLNHSVPFTEGVCEQECEALLKDFFRSLRNRP